MSLKGSVTAADLPALPWLEVINPSVRLGRVRHALFDFDGTISVIRCGWEGVMIPLMVEMICGDHARTPEIKAAVTDLDVKALTSLVKMLQEIEQPALLLSDDTKEND